MTISLRDIEILRAVMRTGTVKGAAELIHVSQPAASKLLSGAERRSGLTLFDRVKGRLIPTPQAYQLYQDLENVWRTLEKTRETARELAKPRGRALRIAASSRFCTYLLPRAVESLCEVYPQLRINVELILPDRLADAMATGTIDMAITMIRNLPVGVATVRQYECPLVCALPVSHRLAARDVVAAGDLRGERLITLTEEAPLAAILEPFHLGFVPADGAERLGIEVTSGPIACWFAQAGNGIAVVDAATVAGQTFPGLAIKRFEPTTLLAARVIRHPHASPSDAVETLCGHLDELWARDVPFSLPPVPLAPTARA